MSTHTIDGIYHYCDRCCWRCRFVSRCACAAPTDVAPPGDDPDAATRMTTTLLRALGHAVAAVEQLSAHVAFPATAEEAEAVRQQDRHFEDVAADPLVALAREYALQALPLAHAVRQIVRDDPALEFAAQRLEEISGTVASKTYRAMSSLYDGDFDADDVQSDANGSAKIARLLIEESRRAWQAVGRAGHGDGVPAAMAARLDALEAGLGERFPRSLEFIRPGFDTDDPASASGQVASAVRQLSAIRQIS